MPEIPEILPAKPGLSAADHVEYRELIAIMQDVAGRDQFAPDAGVPAAFERNAQALHNIADGTPLGDSQPDRLLNHLHIRPNRACTVTTTSTPASRNRYTSDIIHNYRNLSGSTKRDTPHATPLAHSRKTGVLIPRQVMLYFPV